MNKPNRYLDDDAFAERIAHIDSLGKMCEEAPKLVRGPSNINPGEYEPSSVEDGLSVEEERIRMVGHAMLRLHPWKNQEEFDTENNSKDVIELKRDFEICWQVREAFRKGLYEQNINRLHDFIENTFDSRYPETWVEDTFIRQLGGKDSDKYKAHLEKRDGQFGTEINYSIAIEEFDRLPLWEKTKVTQHTKSMCLEHIIEYMGKVSHSFGPGISMDKVTQLDDMLNYFDLAVKVEPDVGDSSAPYYLGMDATISQSEKLDEKISKTIKNQVKCEKALDFKGPVMFAGKAPDIDATFLPIKICVDKVNTMKLIEIFYNKVVCSVVSDNEKYDSKIADDVEPYAYMVIDEIVQQLDLFEAILLNANLAPDSALSQRLVVVQKAHEDFKKRLAVLTKKNNKKIIRSDKSYRKFKKLITKERKKYPAAA